MSLLGDHLTRGATSSTRPFYRVQPQVLKIVLQTLQAAIASTVETIGQQRVLEPRFTQQVAVHFDRLRASQPGGPRYDITHQYELPIVDEQGVIVRNRRLDIRVLFLRQVGAPGDYLGLEFKYLDAGDRRTDAEYVAEGVERIVGGDYSLNHPWAVMVGLERRGPLSSSVTNVDARLRQRYGTDAGLKPASRIRLSDVHQSEHVQAGGPHRIAILHAFSSIGAPSS